LIEDACYHRARDAAFEVQKSQIGIMFDDALAAQLKDREFAAAAWFLSLQFPWSESHFTHSTVSIN
jgi:hypothetical protein